MEKVKITQDELFQYITEHNIKLVRLAELTGLSEGSINSCFKHQLINNGVPRSFTAQSLERMNEALVLLANDLRAHTLKFDREHAMTSARGMVYDKGLIEPMKEIGKLLNLTALCERVLGWSKKKKESVLVSRTSPVYGKISQADVVAINNELLAVAGVLSSYEIVSEEKKDDTK